MANITIEIYGGINTGGGGCACGCSGCTPFDAKAEYEAVKKEVLARFGDAGLRLEFIDTDNVDLAAFPEVEKVVKSGYPFPITVVNGNPKLAGGISAESIIGIVTELQSQEQ
ncbi:MAG: hypothetical protein VB084_05065 [Syntrophomonadaceae bacterium]|nr:hypothetical protein [Syntrophomonadaceae bacterium]